MKEYKDSFGTIKVSDDKNWGVNTQRSLENFKINTEKMPLDVVYSICIIKKACAIVNFNDKKLNLSQKKAILQIIDEILDKKHDMEFPLSVWQTGSGTQTNMNVNEVIANLANKELSSSDKLHPNDHVNMSQSSNDVFPSAIHIAAFLVVKNRLFLSIDCAIEILEKIIDENKDIIKIGRTHLEDAVPLTLGQEFSGYLEMLKNDKFMIEKALFFVRNLAIGGTAVGTGINARHDFGKDVAMEISKILGETFVSSENKFYEMTSKGEIAFLHSSLKVLALDLIKISNDIRWLSSGPRCGIGEITIPSLEAGSSIMPGKVNPTQCEAMIMICYQVLSNDNSISLGAMSGNFELNVCMPIIINNFLQSVYLLSDGIRSMFTKTISGIKPNKKKIKENLDKSLMLATKLSPILGYDKVAEVVKYAYMNDLNLKEAFYKFGLEKEEFDKLVKIEDML